MSLGRQLRIPVSFRWYGSEWCVLGRTLRVLRWWVVVCGLGLGAGLAGSKNGRAEAQPVNPPEQIDQDQTAPGREDIDFYAPDPSRPWGHARYLRRSYRRFGYRTHLPPYRRYYTDWYSYRFGVPVYQDEVTGALQDAYGQGVEDGRNAERFEIQAERGLSEFQDAMSLGHAAFGAGSYLTAVRHFRLAAKLNQGDPSSRLCAMQAEVALGNYESAAGFLRRAIGLQPKIPYLVLDMREGYGRKGDFERHLSQLSQAATETQSNADLWLLLGCLRYFSQDERGAGEAFARGVQVAPEDGVIRTFAELSVVQAPRAGH